MKLAKITNCDATKIFSSQGCPIWIFKIKSRKSKYIKTQLRYQITLKFGANKFKKIKNRQKKQNKNNIKIKNIFAKNSLKKIVLYQRKLEGLKQNYRQKDRLRS